ncbi:MAG: VCBS repeat-containing protein, partial [Planctomycetes bacterium]|nr:VCBS repeat-containing protein [Planctomycetota bacterium]
TPTRQSNDLTLFLQTEPRVFAATQPLPTQSGPRFVVAGDLDGTGRPDLACTNFDSDSISLFFRDGTGAAVGSVIGSGGSSPIGVAIADLDDDGRSDLDDDGSVDILCIDPANELVWAFVQRAPLTFAARSPLLAHLQPVAIAASDLDGDGDTDIVTANSGSSNLTVRFGRSR